jgi:hypothetical protein
MDKRINGGKLSNFFFGKQTFIQTTKEPKALQTAKAIEGDGSFPLHMGVEGGGGGGEK